MALYAYRAVNAGGRTTEGEVQARDRAEALTRVRGMGVVPVELSERKAAAGAAPSAMKANKRGRAEVTRTIDELGVLLNAGLPLDRALALCIENIEPPQVVAEFKRVLADVREGAPLSRSLTGQAGFPASGIAMIEAGEANGKLGDALRQVAGTFQQEEDMRQLIVGAMIYPAALLLLAVGVILMILLYVVPQFEGLFASAKGDLPASSVALMATSQALRDYGLIIVGVVAAAIVAGRQMLRQPGTAARFDAMLLSLPQLGTVIRYVEAARLSHTLGGLIEGGVPLPDALAMACRAIGNRAIATALAGVAAEVREGGALTARLAATGALPRVAIGFIRTGEESSQLGMMLQRLGQVLDREVRLRIERLVAIATPLITIALGGAVAAIIASIMSAILGFNDLAVGQ